MSARVPPGTSGRTRPAVPVADHVTDGVAALLLLTSLLLPWDVGTQASGRVDVVLVTSLSVASLALPHLARAGVFPPGWTVLTTRRARLLANVPYAVLVLVYVVLDAVSGLGDGLGVCGIGYAAALGLAGAVLAAQPRRSELGPLEQDRGVGPLWFTLTAVLVGVCGLLLVVGTVVGAISGVLSLALGSAVTSLVLVLVEALQTAVLALPLIGLLRRDAAWRPVALAVGGAVALGLLCSGVATGFGVATVRAPGIALLLVPAAVAAGTGPAALRTMRSASSSAPAQGWFRVAGWLWLVLAGAAVLQVVTTALQMVAYEPLRGVAAVVVIVLLLVTAVAALAGRARLLDGGAGGVPAALVLAGAGVVVGIVVLAVVGATTSLGASGTLVTVALWLPVAVVTVLTVPPSVRWLALADRASRAGAAQAAPVYGWPVPPTHPGGAPVPGAAPAPETTTAPVQPSAAEPPAPPPAHHPFTAAQAEDPATDPALLATICAEAPGLRPHVAANPSAYPALLQWLAALGDERVDRALRSRPAR